MHYELGVLQWGESSKHDPYLAMYSLVGIRDKKDNGCKVEKNKVK